MPESALVKSENLNVGGSYATDSGPASPGQTKSCHQSGFGQASAFVHALRKALTLAPSPAATSRNFLPRMPGSDSAKIIPKIRRFVTSF
jgi:hypothetical protein